MDFKGILVCVMLRPEVPGTAVLKCGVYWPVIRAGIS